MDADVSDSTFNSFTSVDLLSSTKTVEIYTQDASLARDYGVEIKVKY